MDSSVQLRAGDEEIYVIDHADPGLVVHVLEGLDGRSRADLVTEFGLEVVDFVISELESEGLLVGENLTGVELYLSHFGNSSVSMSVSVVGHTQMVEVLKDQVQKNGMTVSEDIAPGDVVLCVVERPDLGFLEQVNRECVGSGRAVLFGDLSHGHHATVGPFYVPGDGACYQCSRTRVVENTASRQEQVAFDEFQREGGPTQSFGVLPEPGEEEVGLEPELRPHQKQYDAQSSGGTAHPEQTMRVAPCGGWDSDHEADQHQSPDQPWSP